MFACLRPTAQRTGGLSIFRRLIDRMVAGFVIPLEVLANSMVVDVSTVSSVMAGL